MRTITLNRHLLSMAASIVVATLIPSAAAIANKNDGNIAISPVTQEFSLNAGETATGTMFVDTLGDTPINVEMHTSNLKVIDEDYDQHYSASQDTSGAAGWIKAAQPKYLGITRGHRVAVPYTVTIPKDTRSGGYYAVLFAQSIVTEKPKGSGIVNRAQVGTTMYISVKGALVEKGSVASWKSSFWQTETPLTAELRLKNEGNIHYDAVYHETITDFFGNQKGRVDNLTKVLPKTTRRLPIEWKESPSYGLFKVSGTVDYLGRTDQLPSRTVLMLPVLPFLLTVLAAVVLIAYALFSRSKNVRRRR